MKESTRVRVPETSGSKTFQKTPLTEAQESLLAHGPNFAIVPRELTVLEYITSIESTCQQLQQGKAEELRGEIKAILKKTPPSKPNITKEEHQALKQLKKDKNRMVLTADKGVSLVVLDKEDYIQKSEELLQQPNYKILPSDPTTKHKNKLISLLKSIKAEGGINDKLLQKVVSHRSQLTKILWFAKGAQGRHTFKMNCFQYWNCFF